MNKTEVNLPEIIRIILLRKWIIVFSVILFVLGAILFNLIKKPVYQSTVLLKKEIFGSNNPEDRLQNLLGLQSQVEIETEMQLIQTRNVVNSVIRELALNINITKIEEQDGTVTIIDLPLTEYQYKYSQALYSNSLPKINQLNLPLNIKEEKFTLEQLSENEFNVYNKTKTIDFYSDSTKGNPVPQDWDINIAWNNNSQGLKIHYDVLDYNDVYEKIASEIIVEKKIKTNIFEVIVNSSFPYTTKTIANTLTDKFKSIRFLQNKDNIKYSSAFIDERLNEVAQNLATADDSLSIFKSDSKIVQIDEQSKKIVEFLSNLETEKLETDLELGIYNHRLQSIKKQISKEGFIDQTYLTPEQYQSYNSPFSNSLNELSRLEIQKLELLQKRTEVHPDVVMLTEQIEKIKEDLGQYNQNTITALQIISSTMRNKLNDINNLISKYTVELQKLPEQEAKLLSLIRKRDGLEKMYNLLLEKREEMRVAELSRIQDIIVLDPAIEPIKPISPNKKLNLLIAAILGGLIGLLAVLIINVNDKNIIDIYDIERNYNYPILSVIPPYDKSVLQTISSEDVVKNKFVTMIPDQFRYKEAYRNFETKLTSKIKGSPKTVMITSCEENAGKTTTAANLAITAAQSGKKVLLIDCDIKKPSIASLFGLPKFSSGLLDYLTEKTDTPNIYKPIKLTKNSNLLMNIDIIPTGVFSNISGEILASDRMKKLFENLEYYDFVILDTPPITRMSDALSLGRLVKDTVLVVRAKQTVKESISWAVGELQTSDINFLGLFVNDCLVKGNSYKYQYGYPQS